MTAIYGVPGTTRRAGLPQTTCDCGRVPSSQRARPDEIGPLYLDAHGTASSMTLAVCVRTSQTIVSLYVFHLRCDRSGSPDLRDDAGLRRGWYGDHRRDIDSSRNANRLLSRLVCARSQTNSIAPIFRPSSQDLHVVPSTQIGFSHRFALLSVLTLAPSARTCPRWCHLPPSSLRPPFASYPSALPRR